MAFKRAIIALGVAIALFFCGFATGFAWQARLLATVLLIASIAMWLVAINWRMAVSPTQPLESPAAPDDEAERLILRTLLDQGPTPLLALEGSDSARALNRAARILFATDDQILPVPVELFNPSIDRFRYDDRAWRIDRITTQSGGRTQAVLSLVEFQAEERIAEARATRELTQIFGHEIMNGLAPIVSLAESALATLDHPMRQKSLLPEILAMLAKRAEALQRFTDAYRLLARLPEPLPSRFKGAELFEDLVQLFNSHWSSQVSLKVEFVCDDHIFADRDQLTQALWALLQNAAEAALADSGDCTVQLKMQSNENGASFIISDSGAGVPDAEYERIFRFLHTTKQAGTGVGLSISRQIARAHGGDVKLLLLKPATFSFELPHLGHRI
jgi:signal transduction histidine kinase